MKKHTSLKNLVLSAMFLAIGLVLPFFIGQIPAIGKMLLPMHIPVLLAGFLCGPWWAMAVGFVAPMLRHVWLGMPPLITAIAMSLLLENGSQAIFGADYQTVPTIIQIPTLATQLLIHCLSDFRIELGNKTNSVHHICVHGKNSFMIN